MTPLSFQIHTFGCKVNTYDSGLIQARLNDTGFMSATAEPQVHILNTCAVTRTATLDAVKMARRLKIKNPFSLVVVTGCAAQVDTEEFPGVDLVVANSHKAELSNLIRQYYNGKLRERIHKSNIFRKEDLEGGGGYEPGHTRAFLKIQDGCDSFCTFCVIPFARGKSRSLTRQDLVRRVNELVSSGVKEVVFTGVHIGDYVDGEGRLEDLLSAILSDTAVQRIRLSSLEPIEVSERLLQLYLDPRMCRHFHMSIQSTETRVLHAMKRQYDAAEVENSLLRIAAQVPESFVGMDVIAGFPGESDEEFRQGVERLEQLPWTRLHVFPYSSRPGTYAARLPQLEPSVIKRRAEILRDLSARRLEQSAAAQVGTLKRALALRGGGLLSRDYWSIESAEPVAPNEEVTLKVTSMHAGRLRGEAIYGAAT